MNNPLNNIEQQLFYSELESGMYDSTIELVAPCYTQLHHTLMDVLTFHFGFGVTHSDNQEAEVFETSPGWVLDIGSGTGSESISLLRRFPRLNVVALDIAEPMHEVFRANFARNFPTQKFEDRVLTVSADIRDFSRGSDLLDLVPLDRRQGDQAYSVVLSAFAIHHLNTAEKESVYRISCEALTIGGLFANADLFTFQSSAFRAYADEFDRSWITRQFDDPAKSFEASVAVPKEKRHFLKDKWLEHYRDFNDLGPVESAAEAEPSNNSMGIKGQAEMLIQAGFREVACPYRYWQMGILCALK